MNLSARYIVLGVVHRKEFDLLEDKRVKERVRKRQEGRNIEEMIEIREDWEESEKVTDKMQGYIFLSSLAFIWPF